MSAIWQRISVLLKEGRKQQNKQQCKLSHEFDTLLSRAIFDLSRYAPLQLSQLALAVAKICSIVENDKSQKVVTHKKLLKDLLLRGSKKDDFFNAVADVAVCLVAKFDAQGYCNLMQAFSITKANPVVRDGTTLLYHVADAIVAKDIASFTPQNITNVVWALATSNEFHEGLFHKVAAEVLARELESFKPQELGTILRSFATLRVPHGLSKIGDEITASHDLRLFNTEALANVVWAFASMKNFNPKLFSKVADELSAKHLESTDPQHLSMIAWALATSKVSNPALFARIAAVVRGDSLDAQDLANLLWSFSYCGIRSPALFQSMAPILADLLTECNNKELALIAWSYAVANVDSRDLFNSAFADILVERAHTFSSSELGQIYNFHLWQKEEMSSGLTLPQSFIDLCFDAFTSSKTHVSVYHKDVVSALTNLDLHPKENVVTSRGLYLDTCVEIDGKKVGVRVDGQHHFIGKAPTGKSCLRRRQMFFVEGIRLVSIPHWKWTQLGGPRKQEEYLREQLML